MSGINHVFDNSVVRWHRIGPWTAKRTRALDQVIQTQASIISYIMISS